MNQATLKDTWKDLLADCDWIHGLARDLCADGEDAAQDTLLRVATSGGRIRALRPFARKVLANRNIEKARADKRRQQREAQASRDEGASPDTHEVVERFETQRVVAEAVAGLEEPFRTTILRHYFDAVQLVVIARESKTSAGTVRWRLHRAHELLRERLAKTYGKETWKAALAPLALRAPQKAAVATSMLGPVLLLTALAASISVSLWAFGVFPGRDANTAPVALSTEARDDGESEAAPTSAEAVGERVAAAPTREPDELPQAASRTAPTIEEQHATVRARIIDSQGAPIQGATLALRAARLAGGMEVTSPLVKVLPNARSDASGAAVLALHAGIALLEQVDERRRPAPGEPWTLILEAKSPQHVTQGIDIHIASGDVLEVGDIVLAAATELRGRVVDTKGRGIGGAKVVVTLPPFPFDYQDEAERSSAPRPDFTTTTAKWLGAGKFDLSAVPRGPVMVWAVLDGHRSAYAVVDALEASTQVPDLVLEGLVQRNDTSLRRRLAIHVTTPDGKDAAGIAVRHSWGDGSGGTHRTDDQGRCELLWWSKPEEATCSLAVIDERGSVLATGVDANAGEYRLRLQAPRHIDVEVTTTQREPIEEFSVSWNLVDMDFASFYPERVGGTRCSTLAPVAASKWTISAKGHGKHIVRFDDPSSIPNPLRVDLSPKRGIKGRVVSDGKPVAGAKVEVLVVPEGCITVDGFASRYELLEGVETEKDGRFDLHVGEAKRCALFASLAGRAPLLTEDFDFDPAIGVRDFELELLEPSRIEGRVTRTDGSPAARSVILLNDGLGHPRTTLSDLDGRYVFDDVAAGSYEVAPTDNTIEPGSSYASYPAVAGRRFAGNVEVTRGETKRFDIVLASCKLKGRIAATSTSTSTSTLGYAVQLKALHDGRSIDEASVDASGCFEVDASLPGSYELRITSLGGPRGHLVLSRKIELRSGVVEETVPLQVTAFASRLPAPAQSYSAWLRTQQGAWTIATRVPVGLDGKFATDLCPIGSVDVVSGWMLAQEVEASFDVRAPQRR